MIKTECYLFILYKGKY